MRLILVPSAIRQYYRLPKPEQKKVTRKLLALEQNPLAGKKLSGELAGKWSLKAWPYRIIYVRKTPDEIWVIAILHRQGVYK